MRFFNDANALDLPSAVDPTAFPDIPSRGRTSKPLAVLIADDHPIVREGLTTLIDSQPGMRVVAEAATGQEAVERFIAFDPRVALLDLRMPEMNGIQALSAIRQQRPNARVIIMSSYQSEEDIYWAMHAGALGYVLKDSSLENLVQCILTVDGGRMWIPASVGAKLARRVADEELTNRELEVLRIMALGKSNREIGVALNIAESTVKVHITHIFEKLKATGRAGAISLAAKRGLLHQDWSSTT
jgi:two-component system, NarL family, response regulator